tara:strand:- start:203 stop:1108 length:906 start_codon:yes stop_codon:yes gene_type:complete
MTADLKKEQGRIQAYIDAAWIFIGTILFLCIGITIASTNRDLIFPFIGTIGLICVWYENRYGFSFIKKSKDETGIFGNISTLTIQEICQQWANINESKKGFSYEENLFKFIQAIWLNHFKGMQHDLGDKPTRLLSLSDFHTEYHPFLNVKQKSDKRKIDIAMKKWNQSLNNALQEGCTRENVTIDWGDESKNNFFEKIKLPKSQVGDIEEHLDNHLKIKLSIFYGSWSRDRLSNELKRGESYANLRNYAENKDWKNLSKIPITHYFYGAKEDCFLTYFIEHLSIKETDFVKWTKNYKITVW